VFAHCLALLERGKADRKGVTALEYGVIASAAIVALVGLFNPLYVAFNGVFAPITAAL
jgi:Flp pilus assembly pilin Flp